MAKIITMTVDPKNANVEVETSGYFGKGCTAVQDLFTKAAGGEVISSFKKAEFNTPLETERCITR